MGGRGVKTAMVHIMIVEGKGLAEQGRKSDRLPKKGSSIS